MGVNTQTLLKCCSVTPPMLHNVEALLIPKGQKHRNLIGRQSRGWIASTSPPNVVQKFLLKDRHEKSDLGEIIWQKPKSHRGGFLPKLQMGSETWSDWWWLPAARGRKEGEERERWDSDRSGSCLLMEGPIGWRGIDSSQWWRRWSFFTASAQGSNRADTKIVYYQRSTVMGGASTKHWWVVMAERRWTTVGGGALMAALRTLRLPPWLAGQ